MRSDLLYSKANNLDIIYARRSNFFYFYFYFLIGEISTLHTYMRSINLLDTTDGDLYVLFQMSSDSIGWNLHLTTFFFLIVITRHSTIIQKA